MNRRQIPLPEAVAGAAHDQAFPVTRWTLVEKVRRGGTEARMAQEELCRLYWYPIYAFLRRHGCDREDAEDFTQGFFCKVLSDSTLGVAEREKGHLRTFLLRVLKHHLADERHDCRTTSEQVRIRVNELQN